MICSRFEPGAEEDEDYSYAFVQAREADEKTVSKLVQKNFFSKSISKLVCQRLKKVIKCSKPYYFLATCLNPVHCFLRT
jgi:hypothetical protein